MRRARRLRKVRLRDGTVHLARRGRTFARPSCASVDIWFLAYPADDLDLTCALCRSLGSRGA